jgi:hypothetical protein
MTFGRPTAQRPMRSRGFAAMDPERQREIRESARRTNIDVLLATRGRTGVTMGGGTSGTPVGKENASQSTAYMVAVRALGYCMRCGCTLKKGERQFCHADQGKGTGIKTDVRRGWLGCAGCHFHVGTSGRMPKAERRAEEDRLAAKTRDLVIRAGTWPKNLPKWEEPCA